jgi:hypothetical protein
MSCASLVVINIALSQPQLDCDAPQMCGKVFKPPITVMIFFIEGTTFATLMPINARWKWNHDANFRR